MASTKLSRARYTLEFKLEAVRLVKAGQSVSAVAKNLQVSPQTLVTWVKHNYKMDHFYEVREAGLLSEKDLLSGKMIWIGFKLDIRQMRCPN